MLIKSNKISIFFLIAVLVFISYSGLNAERKNKVICDYCKDTIKTQYIEANGKYYHPIHFLCDNCGTVIGHIQHYMKNGKYYCNKCYNELFSPKCAYCGKTIEVEEKYIIQDGKEYHNVCFNNKVALKCAITGEKIDGEYLKDYWGNAYIKNCQGKYDLCEYCGRFISEKTTSGGKTLPDGRQVCQLCLRSAVSTNKEAIKVFEQARDKLAINGIFVTEKVNLHLIDKNRLKQLSGHRMVDPMGYTIYKSVDLINSRHSDIFDIYILNNLPKTEFVAAAAHELMHVWQYKNAPRRNSDAWCEGSCNYAANLVLKLYPGQYSKYVLHNMENSPDENYGEGYRRVKKLVKDKGIEFWLNHLKSNKDFPRGY